MFSLPKYPFRPVCSFPGYIFIQYGLFSVFYHLDEFNPWFNDSDFNSALKCREKQARTTFLSDKKEVCLFIYIETSMTSDCAEFELLVVIKWLTWSAKILYIFYCRELDHNCDTSTIIKEIKVIMNDWTLIYVSSSISNEELLIPSQIFKCDNLRETNWTIFESVIHLLSKIILLQFTLF